MPSVRRFTGKGSLTDTQEGQVFYFHSAHFLKLDLEPLALYTQKTKPEIFAV